MYIGTLVDDIQKVLDNLSAEHGEFVLAMLYNSDSLSASYNWHLIVSAPWTDKLGMFESIHLIAQALHDDMNVENQPAISLVRVLRTSDPFVQEMTFLYPAVSPGAGVPVGHVRAGEITDGAGFIFHSRKPAVA